MPRRSLGPLCTEDIEWVPPDGPSLFGRDAGRALLLMPAIRVLSIQVTDFVVDGAGAGNQNVSV